MSKPRKQKSKFSTYKKRRTACYLSAPLWLCKAVLARTSNAEPTPNYIVHPYQVSVYTQCIIYRCVALTKGLNLQIPKVSKQAPFSRRCYKDTKKI